MQRIVLMELLGRLLATAGEFLKEQAQYREAEPLLRQSLEVRQRALGPEHPEVADSLNKLAMLLRAQGHLEQAEQVCRDALESPREDSRQRAPRRLGEFERLGDCVG